MYLLHVSVSLFVVYMNELCYHHRACRLPTSLSLPVARVYAASYCAAAFNEANTSNMLPKIATFWWCRLRYSASAAVLLPGPERTSSLQYKILSQVCASRLAIEWLAPKSTFRFSKANINALHRQLQSNSTWSPNSVCRTAVVLRLIVDGGGRI